MDYTVKDVATRLGVHPVTLRRWILAGKVRDVRRDRNGWRVFSEQDVSRIAAFAQGLQGPAEMPGPPPSAPA